MAETGGRDTGQGDGVIVPFPAWEDNYSVPLSPCPSFFSGQSPFGSLQFIYIWEGEV